MVLTLEEQNQKIESIPLVSIGSFYKFSFIGLGTTCSIFFELNNFDAAKDFKLKIMKWIINFEANFSRFIDNSLISKINANAGIMPVDINEEAESIFMLCDWFYNLTNGIFDPSILPLLKVWDYKKKHTEIPSKNDIERAMSLKGWKNIVRENNKIFLPLRGMEIDIGGIGKEYAVDRVLEMALDYGIFNILVDFGHDIRVNGNPPEGGAWRIGLENPLDTGTCFKGVGLINRAIATSGNYLRNFKINDKSFGHIIDPRTGYPVLNDTQLVSVIAPTCTAAGILSTVVFILDKEEGLKLLEQSYQAEGIILTKNKTLSSRRFNEYVISK